jgi:calcineurin-like phosphoesterase family protein
MNYWLISDTHFNHLKLEEWGCRSGNWQTQLYEGISRIPAGDTLIHLGDVCIGDDAAVHKQLRIACGRGDDRVRMILVRGNHDKKSAKWYTDQGWDFVCEGLELIYKGHFLHLTHRPSPLQAHTAFNIHGHTHGDSHRSEEYVAYYSPDRHIDISPEIRGYAPLRLDTLLKAKRV